MAANRYLARKSMEDLQAQDTEGGSLKRSLGPGRLLALGIGAIIGAGIFVLTGQAAAQYAGPAIILSFVLGGIACAFAGLCYAEFAALISIAGSAYTYSYATLGELVAWIIGWDLILEYALGSATVAVGWAGYVTSLLRDLGVHLPIIHGFNLLALLGVLAVTALLAFGTKESTRFNAVIVGVKLLVIAAFLGFGAFHLHPANWHPFLPANTGHFG